jgi:5-methylcytosine-specific restriction endonuclease McrA
LAKIKIICNFCGKEFYKYPSAITANNYCSHKCYSLSKRQRILVVCDYCGKEFEKWPSQIGGWKNFCSQKCFQEFNKGENHFCYGSRLSIETRIKISKARKGKNYGRVGAKHPMYGKKHSLETRLKMSKALKGKFAGSNHPMYGKKHSESYKKMMSNRMSGRKNPCYGRKGPLSPMYGRRGKDAPGYGKCGALNPNWTGGKKGYRGPGWERVRQQVLKRDNFTCQHCGARNDIHVHHIIPYRKTKDNSLSNLITLCRSCHTKMDMAFIRKEKEGLISEEIHSHRRPSLQGSQPQIKAGQLPRSHHGKT